MLYGLPAGWQDVNIGGCRPVTTEGAFRGRAPPLSFVGNLKFFYNRTILNYC
jgi:hypothetical protein